MATIVTRETTQTDGTSPKGSPLTNAEVDTNFINLNDDKVEVSGAIIFAAQAAEALSKGDVVYVSGVSGNTPTVSKADADDASKMPAYGLAEDDANLNAAVNVVTFGTLYNLDTSSFSAGDTVYVSTTAGSLTSTKPSGESSLIQNVGKVIRSHASAGSIKVGGAGRTNDTPNLNDGNVFIGNSSNQVEARALTGDDISGGTITSFASTGIDDNATSNAIVIHTNQNVGIGGIANPQAPLHVYKTEASVGETDPIARFERFTTGDNAYLDITVDNDNNLIGFQSTGTNDGGFTFGGAATERMRIAGSGNVGIGATIPGGILHLKSDDNGVIFQSSSSSNSRAQIFFQNTGGTTTGKIAVDPDGGNANVMAFSTGSSERMRIDSSGQVIISGNGGSTTNSLDLSYNGVSGVANIQADSNGGNTSLTFGTSASGTVSTAITIDSSQDVTFTSDAKFSDSGKAIFGAGSDLQIYHDGSNSYVKDAGTGGLYLMGSDFVALQSATGENFVVGGANDSTTIYHNNSAKLATTSTGIDVTGTAVTDGLTVAGNVSVDGGTIKLSGSHPVGTRNTALGDDAFYSAQSGASYNVAVGFQSMYNNTTGTHNVGVGYQALAVNTTGHSNAALGFSSLAANTTGTANSAFGYDALNSNTTAANNSGFGYYALRANTTGTENTAVGYIAMDASTTASYSTALGARALGALTTGSYNTALGRGAFSTATTATNSVAVGNDALYSTTTGDFNHALGVAAMYDNTTGEYNVAVGYAALYNNTTASGNTAVGHNSCFANQTGVQLTGIGYGTLQNATGSANTGVGYLAGYQITSGFYNVAIGDYALYDTQTTTNHTAVGHYALFENTTGDSNTAVGSTALQNNTAGSYNTAVGRQAGQSSTTSSFNTFLGWAAGSANTTGHSNTAVGASSFVSSVTANYSVAVGYQTLDANTTGPRNCAVGYGAMTTNTTGGYNTAFGSYALNSQTTPNFNVGVGYQAGYTTTTGADNTYLGSYAGYTNSAGIRNVHIGYTAGYNSNSSYNVLVGYQAGDSITSGVNLTVIGYDADASSASAQNEVTLGNASIATLRCNTQTISALSDERDKDNIQNLGNASAFIKALRPVSFDWNQRDGGRVGDPDHGFIAQELQAAQEETGWHVPRLVFDANPEKLEASYATLLPSVVSALQEALAEIESLKAQVAELSGG